MTFDQVSRGWWVLPAATGLAFVLAAAAWRRPWRRSALWLGLALVGEAAALQLVQAGPAIHYQHYATPAELVSRTYLLPTLLVALQAVLVFAGSRRFWQPAWRLLRERLRIWQLAVAALVFVMTSATLSRDPRVYATELVIASLIQALNLANVILVVATLPPASRGHLFAWLDRLLGEGAEPVRRPRIDRFALLVAAWVTLLSTTLVVFSYQRHPHVPDEVVYLYGARTFADGRMTLPAPPLRDAFDVDLMLYQPDRWFSPVPPGWPAVLALGVLAGVPWLVDPVLGGLCVLAIYFLAWDLYDRRTARLTLLLLAASPWLLFMSMNLMTHTLELLLGVAGAVAVLRFWRTGGLPWVAAGGVAAGLASLVRPLDGLAAAMVLGLAMLLDAVRRRRFVPLATLVATTGLAAALVLPYNHRLMGNATVFPLMYYTNVTYGPGRNELGFGPNRGLGWPGLDPFPGHGARDVLVNANMNLFSIDTELFGWGTGSLIVLIFFLFAMGRDRRDQFLWGSMVLIAGLYSFYWFSGGPDFGARYWYLVIAPCAILTARGLLAMDRGIGAVDAASTGRGARTGSAVAAALTLSAVALTVFVPWRASDKYYHYRGMQPGIRRIASEQKLQHALVLVRGKRFPDYASAVVYNPLDLRHGRGPIFAWDRSAEVRRKVVAAYPDRPVWLVDGPTVTGDGYRLVGRLRPAQGAKQDARQGASPGRRRTAALGR